MDAEKIVIEKIKEIKGKDIKINPDDKLTFDIGLCSFEMCLLICELEDTFNVQMKFDNFNNGLTVSSLADLIKERNNG